MADRFEEYRTVEGDTVDLIAFHRFGTSSVMSERILDANPGLAALGAILPANLIVRVPVPEVKDRKALRRLWG